MAGLVSVYLPAARSQCAGRRIRRRPRDGDRHHRAVHGRADVCGSNRGCASIRSTGSRSVCCAPPSPALAHGSRRATVPDERRMASAPAAARRLHLSSVLLFDLGVYMVVVGGTMLMLIALAHQSLRSGRASCRVDAVTRVWRGPDTASRTGILMEIVCALAIGVLAGSGVWLLLRPRTFQVIMGLALLSYAVNLLHLRHGPPGDRPAADHRRRRRSTAPRYTPIRCRRPSC